MSSTTTSTPSGTKSCCQSSILCSTIGIKILVAITGLALLGFVIIHMLGNLQAYLPPEFINAYAHKLQSLPWPILWGFRVGLLLVLVVHIYGIIILTARNHKAKPAGYLDKKALGSTLASRTMAVSGSIVLAFILFHLWHFSFRGAPFESYNQMTANITIGSESHEVPDVYRRIVTGFSNPLISGFYILGVGLLCFHLSHGIQSVFRTLGLNNNTTTPWANGLAKGLSLILFVGMAGIPLSVLLGFIK